VKPQLQNAAVETLLGLPHIETAALGSRDALSQLTGFYFAFRLFFVLFAVRVFGATAQAGVGASLVCNYALLGIALLSMSAKIAPDRLRDQPCVRWAIAYIVLTGLSLCWSVTASLPAAVAFWGAMCADAAIVALQLRHHDAETVAHSLMGGFVRGATLIAIIAWLIPAQSDLRLGDEELLGPNQIGWLCGLAFFFAQYLMLGKSGREWKLSAAFLAITLLRSLSKTTIVAFVAAQCFILLRDRAIHRRTRLILLCGALIVVILFSGLLVTYFDIYTNTGAGTQAESLTGRLGIWLYIAAEAMDRPWFGHGFHSVWKVIPVFYGSFEARHAHSELLQQFYAYGAAGVALLVALYASAFRAIRKLQDQSAKTLWSGFLLFVLIRGLADTEAFDLSWPMWLLVLFGALASQSTPVPEVNV
jgi:exopolysaccharide production protein ExoQ